MQAESSDISRRRMDDEGHERNKSFSGLSHYNSNQVDESAPRSSPARGRHSTSDISEASRLFSMTNDTTGMTSFDSIDDGDGNGGATESGVHNATTLEAMTDATPASVILAHHDLPENNAPTENGMVQDATKSKNIIELPNIILCRIFSILATRSYASRLTIPLVCKGFHAVTLECPEMWDTFEVMTGNEGALTSKSQVEYVATRAESVPLFIGVTLALSRIGSWKSEPLRPWSGTNLDEEARSAQTLQIQGLNLVGTILSLMPRVENLILDVQDDPLEPALGRAVLALFDDQLSGSLKRITFIGDYQLDRIVRLTTPSSSGPSLLEPAFISLRHLTVAYTSAYQLPGPLPGVETLEMIIITVETSSITYPLEQFLLSFPNLQSLEIRTTIDTIAPQALTMLGITSHPRDPPMVVLPHLKSLALEALPLTSSILSSLVASNLQVLELRDFIVGFDPRDIRFEMSLAEHANTQVHERSSSLELLPFGTFLARHASCEALRNVTLGGIPDMVVRMCVDFIRMLIGGSDDGLTNLSLLGFEWRDWECLFSTSPPTTPDPVAPVNSAITSLPHLRHLFVFLDHTSTWVSKGTVTFDYEAKSDRQGWMDGLMLFAERRMNPQAVVRMFKESNMKVEDWIKVSLDGSDEMDPMRTLMSVELDAGYKDSYAFVHAAWKAMERERSAKEGLEEVDSVTAG